MPTLDKLIPHIIKWETGVTAKGLTAQELYIKARPRAYANVPGDTGGPTMAGVTIATYTQYCAQKHLPKPTAATLRAMPYAHWKDIITSMFWDKCRASEIASQSVAETIVDWVWMSGTAAIKRLQRLLGLDADGIFGPRTLAAVNSRDQFLLFAQIRADRLAHVRAIAKGQKAKFLPGWENRIKDLKYKP